MASLPGRYALSYGEMAVGMVGPDLWSLGLGIGIGLSYHLASYLMYRRALRAGGSRFIGLYLGGMTLRILVALAVFTIVLAFAPVREAAFAGSFLAVLVGGLAVEVFAWWRTGKAVGRRY